MIRTRCHYCGERFAAQRRSARYCSSAHRVAAFRRKGEPPSRNAKPLSATLGNKQFRTVRVTFAEACAFIRDHHRRRGPPQGHVVSIGCGLDGRLVGVACIGRPVARHADDGITAEVTRLCSDGTPNACSFLLAAAIRAARAIGFQRIITYHGRRRVGGLTGRRRLASARRVEGAQPGLAPDQCGGQGSVRSTVKKRSCGTAKGAPSRARYRRARDRCAITTPRAARWAPA
jgi:hypothetical protein